MDKEDLIHQFIEKQSESVESCVGCRWCYAQPVSPMFYPSELSHIDRLSTYNVCRRYAPKVNHAGDTRFPDALGRCGEYEESEVKEANNE